MKIRERTSDRVPASAVTSEDRRHAARYSAPKLTRFGDIRDVTLGSSPGVGESGNPTVFRP